MKVTLDTEHNLAYIDLVDNPGMIIRTIQTVDGRINLDFNAAGELVGIELLDGHQLPAELKKECTS
jgi:uncharacterized protein YuzE